MTDGREIVVRNNSPTDSDEYGDFVHGEITEEISAGSRGNKPHQGNLIDAMTRF